jgi:hypothetical protein
MRRVPVVFILFFLLLPTVAWAQTPAAEGVVQTNVSTTNESGSDSKSHGPYDDENPPPDRGITDEYGADKENLDLDVSDPINLRLMYSGAAPALTPLMIQQRINPLAPKLFVSGHGRICTYKNGELVEEKITEPYTSKPVPELSETMQMSYQLGPLLGDKYSYAPDDEGTYDFNQFDPLLISGDPPPCNATLEGNDTTAVTTQLSQGSGFFDIFARIFFSIRDLLSGESSSKGTLASAQTGTYYEAVERYTTSQQKGDVSYLPGDVAGETEEAGGALNTFFPGSMQQYIKDDEKPEGAQPNFTFNGQEVKTNDWAANLIQQAAVKTGCMLLPKELQSKFFESGKCEMEVPETAAPTDCKAMIDSWKAADTSCKICNGSGINKYANPAIPGGQLPPSMVKIIEKAADTFHVPASVILGTMYHEGGFSRSQIQWTEENVVKWSCGQEARMPFCDENAVTAQLPLGWFPFYFDAAEGTQAFWNAVSAVDPTRNSKETTSPCNLMDVTFATAKALSLGSARVTGDAALQGLNACYSYPLTNRSIPQSCSAWNDNIVAQTQVNYGGYCPEPGKHQIGPAYPDNNPFIPQTLMFYDEFSCGR